MEQARWERGISVAELARRIGVDRKRLWRVLNGERAMRADEFVRPSSSSTMSWMVVFS